MSKRRVLTLERKATVQEANLQDAIDAQQAAEGELNDQDTRIIDLQNQVATLCGTAPQDQVVAAQRLQQMQVPILQSNC